MKPRVTWFAPDSSAVWAKTRFLLLLFPLSALIKNGLDAFRPATVVGLGTSLSLVILYGVISTQVRASSVGIHRFGEMIRWSSIVSATRKGPRVDYRAAIGLGGTLVERSFFASKRLSMAMQDWLPPEHPIRLAIEGSPTPHTDAYRARQHGPVADGTVASPVRDWLWGSLLSLVVFPGMLALAVMFVRAPFNWIFGSLFLALACWSLFGLAEYFVARFEVRPEGLAFRTSYGGEGVAPWGAVARIRYVWRLQWFVLELRDAPSVRVVACALDHTPELAHALLQRCQAAEVDDVTREFLARIALGHPLSVWRFEPYP